MELLKGYYLKVDFMFHFLPKPQLAQLLLLLYVARVGYEWQFDILIVEIVFIKSELHYLNLDLVPHPVVNVMLVLFFLYLTGKLLVLCCFIWTSLTMFGDL